MKIVGIGGVIVAIIIMLVLSLFAYICLIISSRYDNDKKR
jgi:hypothetical protein